MIVVIVLSAGERGLEAKYFPPGESLDVMCSASAIVASVNRGTGFVL
jgi:hypothetical protein